MSNDYKRPPVPQGDCEHNSTIARGVSFLTHSKGQLLAYGDACAEAARAPLLARIAELEAENQTLTRECSNAEDESGSLEEELQKAYDENDRLRAEVEALRKAGGTLATAVYNATGIVGLLNSAQRECLNNARIRWDAIAARKGAEGDRLGEGSEPPANCRQRLAAEGKAYPRSSCEACGQFAPLRPECDALLEAKRAAQHNNNKEPTPE